MKAAFKMFSLREPPDREEGGQETKCSRCCPSRSHESAEFNDEQEVERAIQTERAVQTNMNNKASRHVKIVKEKIMFSDIIL